MAGRKCQTPERTEQILDAAIELEELPTIAVLNQLYSKLFSTAPGRDRTHRLGAGREKEFLRTWYAQEQLEAEQHDSLVLVLKA